MLQASVGQLLINNSFTSSQAWKRRGASAVLGLSSGFSAEETRSSATVHAVLSLRYKLQALKEKTRIYVPESVLLMGVMDEAGVLAHGELFLQIAPRLGGEAMAPVVITGPVIMGKNPCFHPGDVRLLQVPWRLLLCAASASSCAPYLWGADELTKAKKLLQDLESAS